MKKVFLSVVFALACLISGAQNKTTRVVTDSVVFMPNQVQIFEGVTSSGNPKWWMELPAEDGEVRKVSMSQSHVTSGRLLALIEKRDPETGRYYYSVKFAEPKRNGRTSGKADLTSLLK